MIKNLTGEEIRQISFSLHDEWEQIKKEIKISPRALYNLLKIKKTLENRSAELEEAMIIILEQEHCENRGNGRYHIPDDKKDFINAKFEELVKEKIEIEYSPIEISDDDIVPVLVLDELFDFIEMK